MRLAALALCAFLALCGLASAEVVYRNKVTLHAHEYAIFRTSVVPLPTTVIVKAKGTGRRAVAHVSPADRSDPFRVLNLHGRASLSVPDHLLRVRVVNGGGKTRRVRVTARQ